MSIDNILSARAAPGLLHRPIAADLTAFALTSPAAARSHRRAARRGARHARVAGLFGLTIMVMIYATRHLSGAHINPAVTMAFTLTRQLPPREAAAYIAARFAG